RPPAASTPATSNGAPRSSDTTILRTAFSSLGVACPFHVYPLSARREKHRRNIDSIHSFSVLFQYFHPADFNPPTRAGRQASPPSLRAAFSVWRTFRRLRPRLGLSQLSLRAKRCFALRLT